MEEIKPVEPTMYRVLTPTIRFQFMIRYLLQLAVIVGNFACTIMLLVVMYDPGSWGIKDLNSRNEKDRNIAMKIFLCLDLIWQTIGTGWILFKKIYVIFFVEDLKCTYLNALQLLTTISFACGVHYITYASLMAPYMAGLFTFTFEDEAEGLWVFRFKYILAVVAVMNTNFSTHKERFKPMTIFYELAMIGSIVANYGMIYKISGWEPPKAKPCSQGICKNQTSAHLVCFENVNTTAPGGISYTCGEKDYGNKFLIAFIVITVLQQVFLFFLGDFEYLKLTSESDGTFKKDEDVEIEFVDRFFHGVKGRIFEVLDERDKCEKNGEMLEEHDVVLVNVIYKPSDLTYPNFAGMRGVVKEIVDAVSEGDRASSGDLNTSIPVLPVNTGSEGDRVCLVDFGLPLIKKRKGDQLSGCQHAWIPQNQLQRARFKVLVTPQDAVENRSIIEGIHFSKPGAPLYEVKRFNYNVRTGWMAEGELAIRDTTKLYDSRISKARKYLGITLAAWAIGSVVLFAGDPNGPSSKSSFLSLAVNLPLIFKILAPVFSDKCQDTEENMLQIEETFDTEKPLEPPSLKMVRNMLVSANDNVVTQKEKLEDKLEYVQDFTGDSAEYVHGVTKKARAGSKSVKESKKTASTFGSNSISRALEARRKKKEGQKSAAAKRFNSLADNMHRCVVVDDSDPGPGVVMTGFGDIGDGDVQLGGLYNYISQPCPLPIDGDSAEWSDPRPVYRRSGNADLYIFFWISGSANPADPTGPMLPSTQQSISHDKSEEFGYWVIGNVDSLKAALVNSRDEKFEESETYLKCKAWVRLTHFSISPLDITIKPREFRELGFSMLDGISELDVEGEPRILMEGIRSHEPYKQETEKPVMMTLRLPYGTTEAYNSEDKEQWVSKCDKYDLLQRPSRLEPQMLVRESVEMDEESLELFIKQIVDLKTKQEETRQKNELKKERSGRTAAEENARKDHIQMEEKSAAKDQEIAKLNERIRQLEEETIRLAEANKSQPVKSDDLENELTATATANSVWQQQGPDEDGDMWWWNSETNESSWNPPSSYGENSDY